jgi:hypothetical protein
MIESGVGKFERNRGYAEFILDNMLGGGVGPRSKSDPEHVARLVPHAVACSFEDEIGGQHSHRVDETTPLQRPERRFEMLLLALSLWVPEACEQRNPVAWSADPPLPAFASFLQLIPDLLPGETR